MDRTEHFCRIETTIWHRTEAGPVTFAKRLKELEGPPAVKLDLEYLRERFNVLLVYHRSWPVAPC